jgi:hypothetical protein
MLHVALRVIGGDEKGTQCLGDVNTAKWNLSYFSLRLYLLFILKRLVSIMPEAELIVNYVCKYMTAI